MKKIKLPSLSSWLSILAVMMFFPMNAKSGPTPSSHQANRSFMEPKKVSSSVFINNLNQYVFFSDDKDFSFSSTSDDCPSSTIPFFEGFEVGQTYFQSLECWTHQQINGNYGWEAIYGGNTEELLVFVDDISVNEVDGCVSPTQPVAENITHNSADFSWTPQGDASQWDVAYVEKHFDINDYGIFLSANNPQITLTGLYPGTEYNVYVRSVCEEGVTSAWAEITQLKTDCLLGTIPFFEGFENGQTPGYPIKCWTHQKLSGIGNWVPNMTYPRTGENAGLLYFPNEIWLFHPLELNADTTYEFEFYASAPGPSGIATIEVAFGTDDNAAAMTTVIIPETNPLINSYQKFSGYFTPSTTDTYYIGIKGNTESTYIMIQYRPIKIKGS